MIVASFLIGIVVFLDWNVFTYADRKYCISKLQGNDECMHMCHCVNNNMCSLTDGSCRGQTNYCSPEWIGPGCQYINLAYTTRRPITQSDKVRDGYYWSCRSNRRFELDLQKAYHISSFTVFAHNTNRKMVTRALVTNSTTEDKNIVTICVVNSQMFQQKDFICTHTIFGRYLILQFESDADICEIGIHGGRNIALWKTTNQSSTFNPYTSDKAVDGNVGNYQISSNSCTHTSGIYSEIKPYWELSFKQEFLVQRLIIYFREENSDILKRSTNFSVTFFNNGVQNKLIQTFGKPDRKTEIVVPQPVLVTGLKIGLPNKPSEENVLSLCEVEIFACRLGPDGEVCSDSCPVHCNTRNNQNLCPDLKCPENYCEDSLKGVYCIQKECKKNDLALMNMQASTSCSLSPCLSGQHVNVQCTKGYKKIGSGSVMCGYDGNWTNDTLCKANTCMLPSDRHTHINITGKYDVKFGTTIKITCDPGYHVKGPTVIQCQLNGTWVYTGLKMAPICEENTCDLRANVEHAYLNYTTGKESVRVGTSIEIKCNPGYTLKIPSVVVCQRNGKWDNNWDRLTAVCEENKCDLPTEKHVTTNVTKVEEAKVSFDTTILISCEKEYKLKGPNVTYCQLNGTWNPGWNKSVSLCERMLSDESDEDAKTSPSVAIGVGIGSAVFIVILLIIGITLFMKRRKTENAKTKKNAYMETNDASAGNTYCTIEETENESETALATDNTAKEQSGYYSFLPNMGISRNAIRVENFIDYVEENKGDDGPIVSQFSTLLTGLQYPATVACFKQNKSKNKYKNIYAYDATRVVLNRANGKSDYINASYINGYDSVKRYIASQGPMKGTEEDFWEMVYQLRSDKVVMLTNVFEEGKQKCEQYWPDKETVQFGSMSVQLKSVDRYADFTVRLLSINKDDNGWRNVRQFHFTSWPDRGVPKYASSLVQFRHKVLSMPTKGKGPLIVHCSAGIGRTGAFIALDILVSQARLTGEVDVLACVETVRRQRVNMVQTAEQYQFLHHALEEALMCKTTATAAADFPEIYARMQQRLPNARKREIDKEFQTLNETSPVLQEEEFASGKTAENKKKNRYSNILPVESHRIYLSSYISGRSDYINAVMLPSYKESKAFIATQMPLPDTVVDFLCLVYDNDVSSIVMLNEMNDKTTLGRYWPENESELKIGPFTVTKSDDENMDNIVIQQLQIQYESKEPRIVKQFQIKFWPDADIIPSSVSDVLTLMELVQQWQRQAGGYNPVVVHCMNGCDKTGLYCVVEATIERLKIEQDVGIQQIIKQMRSRRPQIIPCIEQFEFCHEAVLEYMHQNETYSNFR